MRVSFTSEIKEEVPFLPLSDEFGDFIEIKKIIAHDSGEKNKMSKFYNKSIIYELAEFPHLTVQCKDVIPS